MPLGIFQADCDTEIQFYSDSEFNYECTITFNPQLYTVGSAWNEGRLLVESEMVKWLQPTSVDYIAFVMEYQKNFMIHYHLLISSSDRLPISLCAGIVKGLQRIAGRATFKPVINLESYRSYISKDLEKNFDKSKIPHFKIYYR